jgi:hypothetical protein
VLVVGLVVPAFAQGQDESQLWSGKVGLMVPMSGDVGIALGLERQLAEGPTSRTAVELDYLHPGDAVAWYLLYNARYHVNSGGYWGWGAGLNTTNAHGLTDTFPGVRLFYGQNWGRTFGEVGGISGMRDHNTGVLLSLGANF